MTQTNATQASRARELLKKGPTWVLMGNTHWRLLKVHRIKVDLEHPEGGRVRAYAHMIADFLTQEPDGLSRAAP